MTTLDRRRLDNGLEIVFTDRSNRYFGDYHRVCVVATIRCRLADLVGKVDEPLLLRAESVFGEYVEIEKRFERMGVASTDLDPVRSALVGDFLRHAANYLSRPDYPGLLLAAELNRRRTSRFYA